jgi:hypothetical protein
MATATPIPRRLVSLTQAAEILGVSTKSVRRYIAAGECPVSAPNRPVRGPQPALGPRCVGLGTR